MQRRRKSNPTSPHESVILCVDGGSRGNPGPASAGVVIFAPGGDIIHQRGVRLPDTTNNVAEYRALIEGLEACAEIGARRLVVRSDSKLVVSQLTGAWKVKNPTIRSLHDKATRLLSGFDDVRFQRVPRAKNARADRMCNLVLDSGKSFRCDGDQLPDLGGRPGVTTRPAGAEPVVAHANVTVPADGVSMILSISASAKGNPGLGAAGIIIASEDGTVLRRRGLRVPDTTANAAEYAALIAGLDTCSELGARRVLVRTKSDLLVGQMTGRYAIKNERLQRCHAKAAQRLHSFDQVSFHRVPKDQLKPASALAKLVFQHNRSISDDVDDIPDTDA